MGYGEWDFDVLFNEWDTELLKDWGMDLPVMSENTEQTDIPIEVNYHIEVTCADESAQEQLYNELIERGYQCRILAL